MASLFAGQWLLSLRLLGGPWILGLELGPPWLRHGPCKALHTRGWIMAAMDVGPSGSCRFSTSGLMLSSPRVLPAKPPLVGWTWILAQEKAISIRETWCRAAGTLQLESGLPDYLKLRDGRAAAQGG